LSPAEQRVAQHVLAQPRSALNDPIAQIARAAEVSQPTVIRFCRSLGCEGLSDFKLRLASGLTGTIPITHTQVTGKDSMLELGAKVLGNTASAILQARDHLNRDTIERAMRLIADSTRVEIYAVGHYGAVADDAQFKFLRVGVSAVAYTDPRLQALAANLLRPDVVVLIISSSGRIAELLEVAEKAQSRGAKVVAITESQSPLARKADLALIVDHVEDIATQVPMISRILHLLMVDILVVGVTLQRGTHVPALGSDATVALDEVAPGLASVGARRKAPGISAAGTLAHLTSHSR
jgi:glucokinase